MYELRLTNIDATSRTLNAFFVLYSRTPHLAAIGFVWTPLPSLLQLPLLPLLKQFDLVPFAGPMMSSAFGAATLLVLNRLLLLLGIEGWGLRITWLVLIELNPLYLYLSVAGMAEIPFLFFLISSVYCYTIWIRSDGTDWRALALNALAVAVAFSIRYEAVAVAAAMVLAILIQSFAGHVPRQLRRVKLGADLFLFLTPIVYSIATWMFFNWILLDDPLYFQRSAYSLKAAPDVARNVGQAHAYFAAMGSLVSSGSIVLQRIGLPVPPYLPMLAIAIGLAFHRRSAIAAGYAVLSGSVLSFQALLVYQGFLPQWQRYWVYALPFSAILAGFLFGSVGLPSPPRRAQRLKRLSRALFTVGLVACIPLTLADMARPTAGTDEQIIGVAWSNPEKVAGLRQKLAKPEDVRSIAEYIDEHVSPGSVMFDTDWTGQFIVYQVRHPERLVITNDSDFLRILDTPVGNVDYILVREQRENGSPWAQDQIGHRYPTLWANGAGFGTLIREFSGPERWRLYALPATAGARSMP